MSETNPNDLLYSQEHEWVRRLDGGLCRIGITSFAQDELGEVVYVEFPEVGEEFEAGMEIGSIESVKAVADLFTPVAGEVVKVNQQLEEAPEKVNEDPYGEGWLVEIRYSSDEGLEELMNADQYTDFAAGE